MKENPQAPLVQKELWFLEEDLAAIAPDALGMEMQLVLQASLVGLQVQPPA